MGRRFFATERYVIRPRGGNGYAAGLCVYPSKGPGGHTGAYLYPGRADSAAAMAGPTIEAGAQIGADVTILPFVVVGAGALVGAGSVVTRDVPVGMVAYRCPAVAVRAVDDLGPIAHRMSHVPLEEPLRPRLLQALAVGAFVGLFLTAGIALALLRPRAQHVDSGWE